MIYIPCAPGNYQPCKSRQIRFLVIHYTANNGDTAEDNLKYFANNVTKTSAHYFVDETGCGQSVKDMDIAWHCGANQYKHPDCRNANSIGIELCSKKDSAGNYYFTDEAVSNAVALARALMEQYGIDREHVLRHYDVTGKTCPAPMVNNETLWSNFLQRLALPEEEEKPVENQPSKPSAWAEEAAEWAVEEGLFQGDDTGDYQWQASMSREALAVVLKRFVARFLPDEDTQPAAAKTRETPPEESDE